MDHIIPIPSHASLTPDFLSRKRELIAVYNLEALIYVGAHGIRILQPPHSCSHKKTTTHDLNRGHHKDQPGAYASHSTLNQELKSDTVQSYQFKFQLFLVGLLRPRTKPAGLAVSSQPTRARVV
ncbi:hypothetical protein TWF730_009626 [Orbilia blumenaviensis]|uniref:Uncharacterized protein n=1 Tax=Orbilia blumenaviensis TaxID=1796055 RepID=A0AAV9UVU4_9PEZI